MCNISTSIEFKLNQEIEWRDFECIYWKKNYVKSVDWRLTKSSARIKMICGSGRLWFLFSVDAFVFDDTLLAPRLEVIQIEISTTTASGIVLAIAVWCRCFCRYCLYIMKLLCWLADYLTYSFFSIVSSLVCLSSAVKNQKTKQKNIHQYFVNEVFFFRFG